MPNYVTNTLVFDCSPERAQEIMEFLKAENQEIGSIDFNKLIPMPESLNLEAGSKTNEGIEIYLTVVNPATKVYGHPKMDRREFAQLLHKLNGARLFSQFNCRLSDDEIQGYTRWHNYDDLFKLGETACENMKLYGATTWYEWCNEHWGTKWNAFDCEVVNPAEGRMTFETAWSSVPDIIQKLSERFPDVLIHYAWADEDIGYNTGRMDWQGGEMVEMDVPAGGSREAYEMACEIHGYDPDEPGLNPDFDDFRDSLPKKERDER